MPRLLHHHNRLLARPNSRDLRWLLDRAVPAHWWESEINRGLFIQAEVGTESKKMSLNGKGTLWEAYGMFYDSF